MALKKHLICAAVALLLTAGGCAGRPHALTDRIKATYITSEAGKDVWRIDEHGQVNMFLVIGEKKALLIDTGCGEPGLAATVTSLTGLPVMVVNTHGHNDHAMGNREFTEIYAHPADMPQVRSQSDGKSAFTEIRGGYVFDLGGRKLSVIETAGHTRGSVCLLDAENGMLFTGDNNNTHVWLFLGDSLSVEEYLGNLEGLIGRSGEFDVILPGHGGNLTPAHLRRLAENCRAVLSGGVATQPYKTYSYAVSYGPNDALIAFNPQRIKAPSAP